MKRRKNYFLVILLGLVFALPQSIQAREQIVVTIDAGHGGRDPGAIGKSKKIKEKEITLSISKKLKTLLDRDSRFKGVLTRSGDYSVKLEKRSEIARKYKSNILVSIHADVSPTSTRTRGVSVWVLSNKRANSEMGKLLENHEKQSELLGGVGDVLSHNNEKYLDTTVLDLQFSHIQRAGYELGKMVLDQLKRAVPLIRSKPQRASLSVLRSPDIPSILVETGFLSNVEEERALSQKHYQQKIAKAIYNGLIHYRNKNYKALINTKDEKRSVVKSVTKKDKTKISKNAVKYHRVQKNETLYSISMKYKVSTKKLAKLNNIKNNFIYVGQKLRLY